MAPLVKFTVLRLGLFVAVLAVLAWLGAGFVLAVVLAALVSMLLSYVLLRGPRDELAGMIAQRVAARTGGAAPRTAAGRRRVEDEAIEDDLADRLHAGPPQPDRGAAGEAGPLSEQGQADPEK